MRGPVDNINVESVLTKIIPGTLVIGTLLLPSISLDSLNSSAKLFEQSFSSIGVFLFIISSFIAGEVINFLRQKFYVAPRAFYSIIYYETESFKSLPFHSRIIFKFKRFLPGDFLKETPDKPTHIFQYTDSSFTKGFVVMFADNVFYHPDVIYEILLKLLDKEMSPDTRRRRSLYVFYLRLLHNSVKQVDREAVNESS